MASGSVLLRFWAHVVRDGGCWVWTGRRNDKGYGRFGRFRAHRWIWQFVYGPIPDGLWVLHTCDNPPCVRLTHLFLGTAQDNTDDMMRKGRWNPNRALPTGDDHWMRKYPERVPRGALHHAALHPEVYVKGEGLPQSLVSERQASERDTST